MKFQSMSLFEVAQRDFEWWGDDGDPNFVRWHWYYLFLDAAKMPFTGYV